MIDEAQWEECLVGSFYSLNQQILIEHLCVLGTSDTVVHSTDMSLSSCILLSHMAEYRPETKDGPDSSSS